jgi:molybdopterin synthase catalytic subunit
MSAALLDIVTAPLSVETLIARVQAAAEFIDEGCGALCSFVGVVRSTHQGRRVRHLEYEAFEPLALKTFQQIAVEAAEEWPGSVLGIVHRTGRLEVGEASVVIVAAAAHRAESFAVCRYAIERVKQIAPVWKHEFFEDGQAWVEGAVANPSNPEARRLARARACT